MGRQDGGPPRRPQARRGGTGEDALVARIVAELAARQGPEPPGERWAGDDAAVVAPPPGPLLLATDAAVAGVHADMALVDPADLGFKAFAGTVSDLAAMGGWPRQALVVLCLPPGADAGGVAGGVVDAAVEFGCPVVGGDVTASATLAVVVTVTGELRGPGPAVGRGGACPGHSLFVTGPLGSSAAGLRLLRRLGPHGGPAGGTVAPGDAAALVARHRRPRPRLAEGEAARAAGASAMIDVSDGLALDLRRVAVASGVGAALDDVPVAAGATLDEALGGGEDYELVIATPFPGALLAAFHRAGLAPPIGIGTCTSAHGEVVLGGEPVPDVGYRHQVGPDPAR